MVNFKEISDCPCANCIDIKSNYNSENCVGCCVQNIVGWPNYREKKGTLEPDRFEL